MFELNNEQRKYVGLDPILPHWDRVLLAGDKHRPESILYFDGDIIKRQIISTKEKYIEKQYEEATRNREILLPKTQKGKEVPLQANHFEKRTPIGVWVEIKNDRLAITSYTSEITFYDTFWEKPSDRKQTSIPQQIADFIAVSFERDLDSFSSTYKTMNASYLENFKKAISQLKNNDSTNAIVIKQKETTANLYKQADELRRNITFLKDYATRSGLDTSLLKVVVTKINGRNIAGVVKAVRDAIPYYSDNIERIADMPEGFLEKIVEQTKQLDALNVLQNTLMNERKYHTQANKEMYALIKKYIGDIAKAGKLIFQGQKKEEEYVISKIVTRAKTNKQNRVEELSKQDTNPLYED